MNTPEVANRASCKGCPKLHHGAAKGGSYPSFFGRGVYGELMLAWQHALASAGMRLGGLLRITVWWYCSGQRPEQDVWLMGILPFFVFAFWPL